MNTLLIHNDNLPQEVMDIFGDKKLKFDIQSSHVIEQDFTFDKYASDELENVLASKKFDAIYVVINLNKNDFLEFTGLSIANHIRLSHEWNHSHTPIVLLSPLNLETVSRIADNFEVLYTPGIFFENDFTLEAIERISHFIKSNFRVDNFNLLTEEDYQKYLFDIRIQPPGHFDSQHSIDNELTLYHWSKAIGIKNFEIQNEIERGLYFKYVKSKNLLIKNSKAQIKNTKISGKVLLIDDQWERGWVELYRQFFKSPDKELNYVEIKKGDDFIKIKNATEQMVNSFDPDVVLLDLRLTDNDFKKEILIEELSGYRLLEFLNTFFPAIQVIITTASTKASTYEKTIQWAHSYIQKSVFFGIQESLDKIYDNLLSSINIARQIKEFIVLVKKIKSVLNTSDFDDEFKERILEHLNLGNEIYILFLKSKQKRYLDFAFLELYFIVESLSQNSNVFNEGVFCTVYAGPIEYCVVKNYKKEIKNKPPQGEQALVFDRNFKKGISRVTRNIDTYFKVSALMLYRYGLETSGEKHWTKLNNIRKNIAHANKKEQKEKVRQLDYLVCEDDLIEMLNFNLFLLDDNNICSEKVVGAFEIETREKTNLLLEKFNNPNKNSKK
jgi:CheY-like chemotaxis protein